MQPNYYKPKAKPKSSVTMPKIGVDSYVEIAVNTIMHDTDLEDLMALSSKHYTTTVPSTGDELRSEWKAQVENWRMIHPGGGSRIEDLTSINQLHFGALFLQRPESAMYLWTTLQVFYALDRLVCCRLETKSEKLSHMSVGSIAEILDLNIIQELWKKSLPGLRRQIREHTKVPKTHDIFGAGGGKASDTTNYRAKNEALRRTEGIAASIVKLEDVQNELKRNWESHLGGVYVATILLLKINQAAEMRLSMIKTMDIGNTEEPSEPEPEPEEEIFRSIRRSDSFGIVKRELGTAWKSAERGDPSPIAILILLFLLLCLHRMRKQLLAGSEMGLSS